MAKKRKTREQKLKSDLRHQSLPKRSALLSSPTATPTLNQPVTKQSTLAPTHGALNEYQFVEHDLKKTSTITGAIVIAELVIFFLMR